MNKMLSIVSFFLILALRHLVCVQSLFCYECFSVDCNATDDWCLQTASFIKKEAHWYIDYEGELRKCPAIHQGITWTVMTSDTDPCVTSGGFEGACGIGRFRFTIKNKSDSSEHFVHGALLGCMKKRFLLRQQKMNGLQTCILDTFTFSNPNSQLKMEIEHCKSKTAPCAHEDFCVKPDESVPVIWKDVIHDERKDWSILIALISVVVFMLVSVSLAMWCKVRAEADLDA